ncbi:nitroreductase family protein [Megasphaera massiliensis]|uniref:nitroreductase family protein n=1 Tax=Megasphaera TaxID=906 RepID=UPI001D02D55B|nr:MULTISPECIES: nitroreductase family protein [Megasphaera]MBS5212221.1 nitroreductase family protein [Megasphaera sp.]MCB5735524.1 nitroreductase family protein [Megasphaera massiliensis]
MGAEQKTHFRLDKSKCTKCGKCIDTCSGMVIDFGRDGYPEMKEFERFGWRGCWKCQHCLAVCPQGAISIFDKMPEDSFLPPPLEMGEYMERLTVNRRSCRRYLDKNVDPQLISRILTAMSAAPTGGNSCNVEYTVIDDKERVKEIWELAYSKMEADAKKHIYTNSFSDFYYGKMKQSEKTVRKGDLLFCGAPHLFIAHEKCAGKWAEDSKVNCNIATAYFELLANAFGLGTIIMSYPAEVLQELAPKGRELLNIPQDHYMKLIVGFGYPEIRYARGVQKDRGRKIHRYTKTTKRM